MRRSRSANRIPTPHQRAQSGIGYYSPRVIQMISHDPSLYPDYIIAQIQFQARQLAHAGLLALTLEEMLSSRAAYMATCEADWQYHKEQLDAHRAELAAEASAVRVHSNELTRAGFDFDFPEPMNDETFRIVERDDLSDIANLLLRK